MVSVPGVFTSTGRRSQVILSRQIQVFFKRPGDVYSPSSVSHRKVDPLQLFLWHQNFNILGRPGKFLDVSVVNKTSHCSQDVTTFPATEPGVSKDTWDLLQPCS